MITSADLPRYLQRMFSEDRELVAEVEREFPGDQSINTYTYMSEVFWWGIFQPRIANEDRGRVVSCFRAMEHFLSSEDSDLRDAAGIRVTPYLADPALEDLVATHAGVYLQADLLRVRGSKPNL